MKLFTDKKRCRSVRTKRYGLIRSVKVRLLGQLSDHVAECPKCQKRLAAINRIEIALMLMKSQPCKMGLLARANNKTLDVLTHSLRFGAKSTLLRQAVPDTNRLEKARPFIEKILNMAACLFVIVMIKSGISNSLLDYKEQGQAVIHNYYARNLDSQMFDEIFPEDSPLTG
ncbi:MAG: hypothetical protein ABFR90_10635 [Planctomycetota bacterium]